MKTSFGQRFTGENLGSFVRGRTFYEEQGKGYALVGHSTAGDGWSAYALYKDHIVRRDPWTIYEINLQTEEVTPHHGNEMDCCFLTLMPDGCVYTFPTMADVDPPKAFVARYNPRKCAMEIFGPGSPDSWNYCFHWGADEAIYIGGWKAHHAMRFDPVTGDFTDYGPQGPDVTGGIYHIAADDQYLYSTLGGMPYLLNSFHFETGEQEVIKTWDLPQRAVLVRRAQGIYVIVDVQPESLLYTHPTDEIVQVYHLENKELTPVNELPPEDDFLATYQTRVPKPRILKTSPVCRGDGTATLWYQRPGEEWNSVTWQAGDSPSYMFRLGTYQNKIIGASEDPYNLFSYDPETGKKLLIGGTLLHTYAFQEFGEKVYFVGYAGGPVYEWDPRRPWTQQPPNPLMEPPAQDSAEANPRRVTVYELQRRSYAIVLAADNRLYIPCGAYIESIPGGLLGWYDPVSGEAGGIREEFEHAKGMDAETALGGRYVVVATVPWPEPTPEFKEADLVIYDTESKEVTGRVVPKPGCMDFSTLIEWKPGMILGRFTENETSPEEAMTTFYLMDVEAQNCQPVLQLPGVPQNRMIRLRNGMIGCLFDERMTLIDPAAGRADVVGQFDMPPRDWMLLHDDLYAILGQEIHRFTGFANRVWPEMR